MTPSVSVIVPSRLARNPMSEVGNLYADRALMSAKRQTAQPYELILAVDPDHGPIPERMSDVKVVAAHVKSQAAVMNAAAAFATGDVLAFLEDDDHWAARHLEYALHAIRDGYTFVTCSQKEVEVDGSFIRYNDYPSPSGWVVLRSTWNALGGFDESYRWHLDNEVMGKVWRTKERRLHLVEKDAPPRPWLANVAKYSTIAQTGEREPLVIRTRNPGGGMARIASDAACAEQSRAEHARLEATYGCNPW